MPDNSWETFVYWNLISIFKYVHRCASSTFLCYRECRLCDHRLCVLLDHDFASYCAVFKVRKIECLLSMTCAKRNKKCLFSITPRQRHIWKFICDFLISNHANVLCLNSFSSQERRFLVCIGTTTYNFPDTVFTIQEIKDINYRRSEGDLRDFHFATWCICKT